MVRENFPTAPSRHESIPSGKADGRIWTKAALIFLATLLLYFISRSPGLDEFDSVNFALGVRAFNLWDSQPHPPGYPLFILAGWLAKNLLGLDPDTGLHLASSWGGALFIAAWFLIIRMQFNERLGWWTAASLTVTPAVWMTATKVLSDALAMGLLSAEICAAVWFVQRRNLVVLLSSALFGAAATGTRPQLIPIVALILVIALWQGLAPRKMSIIAASTFLIGCLAWLVPMWMMQARLRPESSPWLVYPRLLWGQWQWRLNRPQTFIGAGDWSPHYLGARFSQHMLGWFGFGFGFIQSPLVLIIGVVLALVGVVTYFVARRDAQDSRFWKFHAPWAFLHIAIIFSCLGGAARYYLIIFPLLLVLFLRGWLQMRAPWNWTAIALPLLLLYILVPNAIENHREESPSIRLVRYLERLYPATKRDQITLLFPFTRRHVEWYAPQFKTFRDIPSPQDLPQALAAATAVYTDDLNLPLPAGWRRVPLAVFRRSIIIHTKHHFLTLFLVERTP
jgi:hypothetical protein